MSEKSTWFITGASRGIGLEFVRQLIEDQANAVIASCRSPETASELIALKSDTNANGELHIVKLDVADEDSIRVAAEEAGRILGENGLNYLLNNAGVNPGEDGAFDFNIANLTFSVQHNVVGPALVSQFFLPLLKKGKRKVIMNTTSGLASIGLDCGKKCCTYSISKAALNMLTYKQSKEEPDIIAIVVDPGWVKTKLGGEGAVLEPRESVFPFITFLKGLTREHSGKFFNYKGQPLPW
ncbi:NAD(P)-binding protein [Phellopilus nigrolimitatus]|nr:NAD(P)-binding protein [Phellopilus nigrolimitatus]